MHFWLAESECFSAGNKMISTAIYQVVVISTSKLFKYNKIAQACRASAICIVFEKFTSSDYTNLNLKSCCCLLMMYMKNLHRK